MKKILFFSIALQLIITANLCSQSGWVWQNPLPQGNNLNNIKMFNTGTGYCHSYYNILRTSNFGSNWQIVSYSNENIHDTYWINEQTGYYLAGDVRYAVQLYKTVNGGSNWLSINTFSINAPNKLYWINSNTGFALKTIQYGPGTKIFKTTNAGLNWTIVFNDATILINSITFPSITTGYIVGKTLNSSVYGGKFLKTTNGGISWDSSTIHGVHELNSVFFLNDQSGYISGVRILNGPSLLRTTTGGLSWDSVFYSNISSLANLEFINFSTGYGGNLFKTTNAGVNWLNLNPYQQGMLYENDFSVSSENINICGDNGFLGKSTNGGSNWAANSSGFYGNLNDIKFFDQNTGIASGIYRSGIILRTTNAGLQWDTTTIDANEALGIYIFNENIAYIGGTGKIFKTTNKGASFTSYQTQSTPYWYDVSFPNENTGYVVSKYRMVDRTTDSGNTWINVLPYGNGEYFTICFMDGNTGFIGGGKTLKTTNGGASWDTVQTGIQTGYYCNKIRYMNSKLYSLGSRYLDGHQKSVLMTSTNSGLNWQVDSSQNDYDLYDISIPAPNFIYLMGTRYIHKSVNNSNWSKHDPYIDNYYYNAISFVNETTGWISTFYGGILKTTNGGGTPIGINPGQNEVPNNFSLSQNYPNPFNPVTIISYSLPKNTQVRIIVYDILGRLIKQLVNKNQSPGKYSVSFDGTDFASGVYFYTIETPDFTQSKKMVLLK